MAESVLILLANFGLILLFIALLCGALLIRQIRQARVDANAEVHLVAEGRGINPENVYWFAAYDCRHTDVEIKGLVPRARYWSIIPYNRRTLPLNNYLFDETIVTDDDSTYIVYLTTRPQNRQNEIDVSALPRGSVLIRITLPESRAAVVAERPTINPIGRCQGAQDIG